MTGPTLLIAAGHRSKDYWLSRTTRRLLRTCLRQDNLTPSSHMPPRRWGPGPGPSGILQSLCRTRARSRVRTPPSLESRWKEDLGLALFCFRRALRSHVQEPLGKRSNNGGPPSRSDSVRANAEILSRRPTNPSRQRSGSPLTPYEPVPDRDRVRAPRPRFLSPWACYRADEDQDLTNSSRPVQRRRAHISDRSGSPPQSTLLLCAAAPRCPCSNSFPSDTPRKRRDLRVGGSKVASPPVA